MGRGSWLYDLDANQDEYDNFKIQEAGLLNANLNAYKIKPTGAFLLDL